MYKTLNVKINESLILKDIYTSVERYKIKDSAIAFDGEYTVIFNGEEETHALEFISHLSHEIKDNALYIKIGSLNILSKENIDEHFNIECDERNFLTDNIFSVFSNVSFSKPDFIYMAKEYFNSIKNNPEINQDINDYDFINISGCVINHKI